jgi:hypothetical protein
MAKQARKRSKLRPFVEAERDACNLVTEAILEVLNTHSPRRSLAEIISLRESGCDPDADLRAAVVRGAQRAVKVARELKAITITEQLRRFRLKFHPPEPRNPEDLLATLDTEEKVKEWAVARMRWLVDPPLLDGDGDRTPIHNPIPARQAASSIQAALGYKYSDQKIRGWWRRAKKQ